MDKSIIELEKISDFYQIDLVDLMEDYDSSIKNSKIKIDHTKVSKNDFESISKFGRIVKNYLKMVQLDPSFRRDNRINQII